MPTVRTPLSLDEQLEHLHFHEAPARCKSPCCSPLRPRETPHAEEQHHQHQQVQQESARPALNRNAASHHTDRSVKSVLSNSTDGSSCLQSEDSGLPDYLSEVLDMATFEQVRKKFQWSKKETTGLMDFRSSKWTIRKKNANSAPTSSSTSSAKQKTPSLLWMNLCN